VSRNSLTRLSCRFLHTHTHTDYKSEYSQTLTILSDQHALLHNTTHTHTRLQRYTSYRWGTPAERVMEREREREREWEENTVTHTDHHTLLHDSHKA